MKRPPLSDMGYARPPYPAELKVDSLGTLRVDAHREHTFSPERRPLFRGREVELYVHVISEGSLDMAGVPAMIDRYWKAVQGSVDEMLEHSQAEVADAIEWFWGLDEPPPSPAALLAASRLDRVDIFANQEEGNVSLTLSDEGELIGGHDLTITFDRDLNPWGAGFDG